MARPRETSFSFTAVSWTDPAGKGLQHLEEGRLQRQGRADVLDALHSPASLVHDLDRGRSRAGRHPPHEHAHPARLPTPTQDVSDHIEALPRQYDTFAAVRFPRIESGNPILQRSGPSFIEARRSSGHESGIVSASAYSRSAVNSHLMVHVGAAIATSVDPGVTSDNTGNSGTPFKGGTTYAPDLGPCCCRGRHELGAVGSTIRRREYRCAERERDVISSTPPARGPRSWP